MWVVCCSNCTWMWSSTVRTTQSHRAQQFAAVKTIGNGFTRASPETVSVGAPGEVCRRLSRVTAAEIVRVRRTEAITRACPETVSVGAPGKRALNYHETGSEECVDRGLITSREANP